MPLPSPAETSLIATARGDKGSGSACAQHAVAARPRQAQTSALPRALIVQDVSGFTLRGSQPRRPRAERAMQLKKCCGCGSDLHKAEADLAQEIVRKYPGMNHLQACQLV